MTVHPRTLPATAKVQHTLNSLAVITLVLLIIAGSRLVRLRGLDMNSDEIWSVWQTFGTPAQILNWTPYDWPPLYYLSLGAWRTLVGIHPIVLRLFSTLLFLVSAACMYRAWLRLRDQRGAILITLAYAALSYSIYLGITVRGYILALALFPPALWLLLRYFARPTLLRGILLALCMAGMLYAYFTSIAAFAMLGLFSLIVYPRRILRWWLPGLLIAILITPLIIAKTGLAVSRAEDLSKLTTPPLVEAFLKTFNFYSGYMASVWGALLILATVLAGLATWRRRSQQATVRLTFALLVWLTVIPLALYVTNPVLGFFRDHYSWWVIVSLTVWIGWGLSFLPAYGKSVAALILIGLMFAPIPVGAYKPYVYIATDDVAWLSRQMQAGDVVLIDPDCDCDRREEWDYYMRVYFPNGIDFVHDPANYRRIWFISNKTRRNPKLEQAVRKGRTLGDSAGITDTTIQLYEMPPDVKGIPFANGMRFHGAAIIPSPDVPTQRAWHKGESVRLRLWWSIDKPVDRDYGVGLYFLDAKGKIEAQRDEPLTTSQWQTRQLYTEDRAIQVSSDSTPQLHVIYMSVYQPSDGTRITAPENDNTTLLPIQTIFVKTW
ncbi:MAG: hypothetical protein IT324_32890 [Anaerolineae bacterium]|nr:hypothetical protein [Anaerolineae bacterium]